MKKSQINLRFIDAFAISTRMFCPFHKDFWILKVVILATSMFPWHTENSFLVIEPFQPWDIPAKIIIYVPISYHEKSMYVEIPIFWPHLIQLHIFWCSVLIIFARIPECDIWLWLIN